ncbi:hypothetical protein BH09BAC4_BH09BAC4_41790 [soil metagenome]
MITHLIGSFISVTLVVLALLVSQAWTISQMIRNRINIREFLLY